jgi:hypothetical protein
MSEPCPSDSYNSAVATGIFQQSKRAGSDQDARRQKSSLKIAHSSNDQSATVPQINESKALSTDRELIVGLHPLIPRRNRRSTSGA